MRYGEADRILHLYTPDRGRIERDRQGRAAGAQPLRRPAGAVLPAAARAPRRPQRTADRHQRGDDRRRIRGCASDAAAIDAAGRALRRRRRACSPTATPTRRLPPARQRARAARRATRPDAARANALAFRLKLLLAAGLAATPWRVRKLRGARSPRRASPAPQGGSCAPAAKRGRSRSQPRSARVPRGGARAAAGRGAGRARARAAPGRARDRDTVEQHAHIRLRAASAEYHQPAAAK